MGLDPSPTSRATQESILWRVKLWRARFDSPKSVFRLPPVSRIPCRILKSTTQSRRDCIVCLGSGSYFFLQTEFCVVLCVLVWIRSKKSPSGFVTKKAKLAQDSQSVWIKRGESQPNNPHRLPVPSLHLRRHGAQHLRHNGAQHLRRHTPQRRRTPELFTKKLQTFDP